MQLGVELGHHRARAHLVQVIVHTDHFGARGVVAVEIDRHEIAVDGRAVHDIELRVVLAQAVELALHLVVADGKPRQRDLQTVVTRDGDERAHLHHGVEGHAAAVLTARDVDLGLGNRVELRVDDGTGVEVGQGLAERLGAQRAGASHAGLEHLARHLAGPEARHPHLLGQRAHDIAERFIEFGLVHLNAQADEVPLHWLCCRTYHEPITLPAVPRPGRTTHRRGAVRSEHEVHGAEHGPAHDGVAVHGDRVARHL